MRRRRNNYKFTEKSQSIKGIIAFSISIVLVLLYGIFVYLSYKAAGNLSAYYGSVGVIALLVALAVLVISISSLMEEDTFKLFPRMALGISIVALLLWGGTYIVGFLM